MTSRDIIVAPVITEKSMAGTAFQQYAFEVHTAATKTQIKSAIREIFKVDVVKINTVNVLGKSKNFARRNGGTAASSSARSRAATSARSTRRNARPRCSPRSRISTRTVRSRFCKPKSSS